MTDPFFDLGVQITLLVQSLGGWLAAPMQFFSFLGNEEFFLLIMPALFWCVDAGLGLRVGTMLMLSNSVNHIFKLAFQSPRPYFYTSEVQALISESSFGIPSGHAQNAAAVWGLLGVLSRRGWVLVTMIVVTFLVVLSAARVVGFVPSVELSGEAVQLVAGSDARAERHRGADSLVISGLGHTATRDRSSPAEAGIGQAGRDDENSRGLHDAMLEMVTEAGNF